MHRRLKFIAMGLVAAQLAAAQAMAGEYASSYRIAYGNITIGKSDFNTRISDGTFQISGSLRSSGIAALFTSIKGTIASNGQVGNGGVTSSGFDVQYVEGKTSKRTKISFSGGSVTGTSNEPVVQKKGKWVDIRNGDLNNVLDPMAAMLIPAGSMREVCSKTLNIYDGAMRADFPMRYLRTMPFSTRGFKGDVVTCRASFKPISGFDADKKDINWMRDNGYADISFAPVGTTGLYAPVMAKISVRVGTINIRARKFQTLTN